MTNAAEKKIYPRIVVRFGNEAEYATIHRAAQRARLSMNEWMVRVLLEAAGPLSKKPWKRQENRNSKPA